MANKPVGFFKEGGKTKPITSRKSGISKMSKSTSSIVPEWKTKLMFSYLESKFPHGSGFDGDWYFEDKGNHIIASNSYHVMDSESGMYDGWANFTVKIPKDNPREFKLHFDDSDSQYLNRKHMLRGFLEDTIAYTIDEL